MYGLPKTCTRSKNRRPQAQEAVPARIHYSVFTRPITFMKVDYIFIIMALLAVALVNYLFIIWRHLVHFTDKTVCIIGLGRWLTHASPTFDRIELRKIHRYATQYTQTTHRLITLPSNIVVQSSKERVLHLEMCRSVHVYNFEINGFHLNLCNCGLWNLGFYLAGFYRILRILLCRRHF